MIFILSRVRGGATSGQVGCNKWASRVQQVGKLKRIKKCPQPYSPKGYSD